MLGRHDGTSAEAEGPVRAAADAAAMAKLELQRAELRATEAALLARIMEIEKAMIEAGRGLRATRDALGGGMLALGAERRVDGGYRPGARSAPLVIDQELETAHRVCSRGGCSSGGASHRARDLSRRRRCGRSGDLSRIAPSFLRNRIARSRPLSPGCARGRGGGHFRALTDNRQPVPRGGATASAAG